MALSMTGCTDVKVESPSATFIPQDTVNSQVPEPSANDAAPSPSASMVPVETDHVMVLLDKLDSEQVILVSVADESDFHATLSFYEKSGNEWIEKLEKVSATVGKYGINKEKEGDLKSPTGIYTLGSAFGFKNDINGKYPFLEVTGSHHWVDDSDSIYYNQLVNYSDSAVKLFKSAEQLITYDVYKYGIFIDYNLENVKNLGSAIFMHIYRGEDSPTGGCIALEENNLKFIIEQLDIFKNPLIIIGDEKDYQRFADNAIDQPVRLPDGFVYAREVIPDILIDARYFTGDNFMGRKVDGYESNTAIMTYDTAIALKEVQKSLLEQNLSLVVFDAYRPQRAVDDFVSWVNDETDITTKDTYYPFVEKSKLIEYGYIASLSGHSKGNTVDVSIFDLRTGQLFDMGTSFDYFGEASHYSSQTVTKEQSENREKLREAMISSGFSPYENEWWHFSYQPSEYADSGRYDFIVKY